MTDLVKATDEALEFAKEVIMKGEQNPALALLHTSDEKVALLPIITKDEHTKRLSIAVLKMAVKETGADVVVFVTEGWGLEMPKGTTRDDIEKMGRPSESPNRYEMLIVEGKSATGSTRSYILKIRRGDDGVSFETVVDPSTAGAKAPECRFTNNLWGVVH